MRAHSGPGPPGASGDSGGSVAGFRLTADSAAAYQRHLVPAFFAPCAARLLEEAAPRPGDRVLDVACGTGVVARAAARAVGPTGEVVGADVSDEMLAVARSTASGPAAAPVRWHRTAAEDLPFDDASFDLVCCQQGLQFFADRAAALARMRRVLVPSGRVAAAVWRPLAENPPYGALAAVLDRFLGEGVGEALRRPFPDWSAEALREWFLGAGFAGVRIRIGVIAARFPSVDAFLHHEAMATPAAPAFAAADDGAAADMAAGLARSLGSAADDDGVTFPMQTWLVTGAVGGLSGRGPHAG